MKKSKGFIYRPTLPCRPATPVTGDTLCKRVVVTPIKRTVVARPAIKRWCPPRLNQTRISELVGELQRLDQIHAAYRQQSTRVAKLLEHDQLCRGLFSAHLRAGGRGDAEGFSAWLATPQACH